MNKFDEIRKAYQTRTVGTKIRQAEDGGNIIEGYFIRFNEPTELFPGCFETVLPKALKNFDANDLRALWNHNTQYVIGRGSNNTIEAKKDDKGLWGRFGKFSVNWVSKKGSYRGRFCV